MPDYNDAPILDQQWDVVILGHEPPSRRGHDAMALRDRCRFMLGQLFESFLRQDYPAELRELRPRKNPTAMFA